MAGWPPGRPALYALVYGPSDWSTDAALIAFAFRASAEPALRPEVEAVFGWLRGQVPDRGYTSFEPVLAQVWLGLGNHAPQTQAELEGWIETIEDELATKNRVKPPTRRYGGSLSSSTRSSLGSVTASWATCRNKVSAPQW